MTKGWTFILGVVLGWFLPRIIGMVRGMATPKAAPAAPGLRAA